MGFIDIHTHILPGVDDGAENIEQSLKLLLSEKKSGSTSVMLTPHFYPDYQTLNGHFKRINDSFLSLREAIKNSQLPEIYLGCELKYYNGISNCDILKSFCLGNTDYLLLELPFLHSIDDKAITEIMEISDSGEVKIIIAHLERYYRSQNYKKLLNLVSEGYCTAQIDTSSLFSKEYKKPTVKLINSDLVSYIASDVHSLDKRPVTLSEAKSFMLNNKMEKQLKVCLDNSERFENLLNDNK